MSQRNERSMPSNSSSLTHWLIHQAAHRAPEDLSSRLEEEWLADLQSRSATWSRLRFAVGCCWATLVIANDYPRNRVAAASSGGALGWNSHAHRSKFRLLLAALRHAILNCGTARRALFRADHQPLAYAQGRRTPGLTEPQCTVGAANESTYCSRLGFESLDDYRAETRGGIAAPAGYRRGDNRHFSQTSRNLSPPRLPIRRTMWFNDWLADQAPDFQKRRTSTHRLRFDGEKRD